MISIACQPMNEVAPKVRLREFSIVTAGSDTAGVFRGAGIAITAGGTAKNYYTVEDYFLHAYTVANASGNTDITAYPTLTRANAYEGEDVVLLTRGDYQKRLNLDFTSWAGTEARRVSGIAEAASYLRYSYEWLANLLDEGGGMDVFTGANRNPACWAHSLDLTGIPYSNTNGGSQKNSGAITRRHLPGNRHYPIPVGTVLTFRTLDNISVQRTVIGISEGNGFTADALVYTLNADLPESIKVYPVAGRWLQVTDESGATFVTGNQFYSVFVNQDREIGFQNLAYFAAESKPKYSGVIGGVTVTNALTYLHFNALLYSQILPESAAYSAFAQGARVGDSGSAIFVPVAGGLALAATFENVGGGPFMDEDFVNALIASADSNAGISTGYTVTVAPDPTL